MCCPAAEMLSVGSDRLYVNKTRRYGRVSTRGRETHGGQSYRHGRFDHIVLTVNDTEATVKFSERAVAVQRKVVHGSDGQRPHALRVSDHKINLLAGETDKVRRLSNNLPWRFLKFQRK